MKKLFMAFAAAALLVGCAKEYDDSALRKDLSDLKGEVGKLAEKVSTLESNMKAIVSFPDQLIQSVQELKDDADNVYGYTVTYVTGESYTYKIDVPTNADDPAAQVIGLAKDEEGTWWWTLNGEAIYPLQVFNYIGIGEDGHLYVGGADRGLVQDAIIQSITDTAEGLVITLYSGDSFTIPKAANFALKFERYSFAAKAGVPVEAAYTLENAPEGTVVDYYAAGAYEDAVVLDTEAKKITVTPPTPFVKGSMLVFADSQIGYTSIKKLTFEGETFDVTDTPTEEAVAAHVDYVGEAVNAEILVKGVYNVPFVVEASEDWIHAVQTKADAFEVTITLDDNPKNIIRTGEVKFIDADKNVLKTITIAQKAGESVEPFNPQDFPALDWSKKESAAWYYFKENYALPNGFTFILHIYPYHLNTSGMRVGNFGNNNESPCNMLRFGQAGDNAELEWMVDYQGGRSQKELLAKGFETEKWQAIVLTADAATNTYKIYRNSTLGAEKQLTYNQNMGFGAFEFGNSWGASWRSAFDGRMAFLSVYDKALSEEEIKANIFVEPVSDACVGFWPMTEGEGSILAAAKGKKITESIDLKNMTRTDNESSYIIVDVTENVTWTTGNKFETEEPGPEPIATANKAPYMKNIMFGVTFPDEYAALDETSFEGWVYPKSYDGAQANLPTFMGTENAFMVRFENHKPQIVLGDPVTGGGEIKASSPTALGVNQWYHIAATYKRNDKIVLYVNGEQVAENTTKDFPVTYNNGVKEGASDDAAIGRKFWVGNAYSTRWFDGNMSHLRVWSKALTLEEIKASANNKELTTADGLIANWPLNEAEGVAIVDVSGNNFNTVFKTYSSSVEDAASATREDATLPDLVFAESLELSEKTLKLMKGDEKVLTVSVKPDNAMVPEITWESSDADIVSVNGGTVLAKGVGSATITAKATVAGTEISAACEVTVSPLTGVVAPHMKENYFRTMGGFGDLEEVTVEWKMNAKYDNPEVSSVFGKEGSWLLRVGDAGIGRNELQLATNHGNWTTGVTFENDKWYHVAVTYKNGGAAQVYVNGELKAENAEFATAVAGLTGSNGTDVSYYGISANDDVKIGASYMERGGSWGSYYAVNNRWLDGQLCEVRVWNKVRSASEIAANMNNLEDTSSENLLAYYKMDLTDANTGNGNTIKDYSSAGKDLVADTDVRWQQGRDDIAAPAPAALSVSEFIALDDNTEATFEGIVAALASKGFVVTDGKQNLYVYQNAAPTVKAGDKVSVSAKKITYYGLVETDKANVVVTVLSSGNAIPTTEVADITATLDTFPETASTSVMVKLEGTVAISGNYVNFNVEGAKKKGSLHGLDFSGENGKKLAVTGYYIGTSGSGGAYVNIAATSFEAL